MTVAKMNSHNELVFGSADTVAHVLLLVQIRMQYHLTMYTLNQDKRMDRPPVVFDKILFLIIVTLGGFARQFEMRAFWIVLRIYNRNRISIS